LQVVNTLLITYSSGYNTAFRLVDKVSITLNRMLKSPRWTLMPKKFSTQLTGIIVVIKFKFLKNLKLK